MIASLPRSWSIRKIESSGKTERATWFSARADARSRPNGFSTITRAFFANPAAPKPLITVPKSEGGIAKIMCRSACFPERFLDRRKGTAVVIVSAHIFQQRQKVIEGALVIDPARLLDALRDSSPQSLQTPFGKRDADDRTFRVRVSPSHRVRGKSSCGPDRPSRHKPQEHLNERCA